MADPRLSKNPITGELDRSALQKTNYVENYEFDSLEDAIRDLDNHFSSHTRNLQRSELEVSNQMKVLTSHIDRMKEAGASGIDIRALAKFEKDLPNLFKTAVYKTTTDIAKMIRNGERNGRNDDDIRALKKAFVDIFSGAGKVMTRMPQLRIDGKWVDPVAFAKKYHISGMSGSTTSGKSGMMKKLAKPSTPSYDFSSIGLIKDTVKSYVRPSAISLKKDDEISGKESVLEKFYSRDPVGFTKDTELAKGSSFVEKNFMRFFDKATSKRTFNELYKISGGSRDPAGFTSGTTLLSDGIKELIAIHDTVDAMRIKVASPYTKDHAKREEMRYMGEALDMWLGSYAKEEANRRLMFSKSIGDTPFFVKDAYNRRKGPVSPSDYDPRKGVPTELYYGNLSKEWKKRRKDANEERKYWKDVGRRADRDSRKEKFNARIDKFGEFMVNNSDRFTDIYNLFKNTPLKNIAGVGKEASSVFKIGSKLFGGAGAGAGAGASAGGALASGAMGGVIGLAIVGTLIAIKKIYKVLSDSSPILQAVNSMLKLFKTLFFMPIGNALGEVLLPLAEGLIDFAIKWNDLFIDFTWEKLGTMIFDALKGWWNFIFVEIPKFFTDLWYNIYKGIFDWLGLDTKWLDDLHNWINSIYTGIQEWISDPGKAITDFWNNKFCPWLQSVWHDLCEWWNDLPNKISNALSTLWNFFSGFWVNLASTVWSAISELGSNIGDGVKGFFQNILPFATGGVVTSPTLGLVGEAGPEAIIPLSQFSEVIGSASGGSVNVYISGDIYGVNDLDARIKKAINASSNMSRYR